MQLSKWLASVVGILWAKGAIVTLFASPWLDAFVSIIQSASSNSHQHASKNRGVFCSEIVKSAVNLAIEEQVSQAVESRNASSPKTKHSWWNYGSFAKLRRVSVLEISTAFYTLIIFLKLAAPPSFVSKISRISHNNLSFVTLTWVPWPSCARLKASLGVTDTAGSSVLA